MNISNFKKKSVASLLIICFVLTLFSIQPEEAEALIPSVDPSAAALLAKEMVLDPIVWALVKVLSKALVSSLTRWVDSGFDGAPLFATNPTGFLLGIGDNVFGDFIRSSGFGALCSPFRVQVQGALLAKYRDSRTGSRDEYEASCRLSTITNNVQQFINGDITQGGWPAWLALTQDPQGNPYSTILDAQAQASIRITGEKSIELGKLNWANGFIESSSCRRKDANGRCVERGTTKTPGNVIAEKLNLNLGSDTRTLELADEVSELIGALLNQVIGRVFTGAKGLFSGTGSGTGSGGGDDPDFPGFPRVLTVYLIGENPQMSDLNQPYLEYGAYAIDPVEGYLPDSAMSITGNIDVENVGIYQMIYTAVNQAGEVASTTRTVYVTDPNAQGCRGPLCQVTRGPVITLAGPTTVFVRPQSTDPAQRTYTEPGYTATARTGEDLTPYVIVTRSPDMPSHGFGITPGYRYILSYDVIDPLNSVAARTVTRTVWVISN